MIFSENPLTVTATIGPPFEQEVAVCKMTFYFYQTVFPDVLDLCQGGVKFLSREPGEEGKKIRTNLRYYHRGHRAIWGTGGSPSACGT